MNEATLKHYCDKYPFRELHDKDGKPLDQFLTCPVRLAFANLAEPRVKQSGKKVYSGVFIVPPAADLTVAKAIAGRVGVARFGERYADGVRSGDYKWPLRPQAKLAEKGYAGFSPDGFFFEAQRSADIEPVPIVGPDRQPIDAKNKTLVYSGMWCLARIRVFAYPQPGAKGPGMAGVGFGLAAIQKLADDEEFKGGSAADAFGEIEAAPGMTPARAPAADAFDFV